MKFGHSAHWTIYLSIIGRGEWKEMVFAVRAVYFEIRQNIAQWCFVVLYHIPKPIWVVIEIITILIRAGNVINSLNNEYPFILTIVHRATFLIYVLVYTNLMYEANTKAFAQNYKYWHRNFDGEMKKWSFKLKSNIIMRRYKSMAKRESLAWSMTKTSSARDHVEYSIRGMVSTNIDILIKPLTRRGLV